MKTAGIYKILNKFNGRFYVGSSNNVERRMFYEHLPMLQTGKHFNKHLQYAWDKYGEGSFEFLIVKPIEGTCSDQYLLDLEQVYLDTMKKNPSLGYNTTYIAGKVEFTKEVREKMRIATKRYQSVHGHPFKGKHHTEITRQHLSIINTGKKLLPSSKLKISGEKSVAHRSDVKAKKRSWWEQLKQNPIAYAEFCKSRAEKSAKARKGDNILCKKL
jgi:group I intron endonuclease